MFKILEMILKTSPYCLHFTEESTEAAKRLGNLPKVICLLRDRGNMQTWLHRPTKLLLFHFTLKMNIWNMKGKGMSEHPRRMAKGC